MNLSDLELKRRHTASHIMSAAVRMLYPDVKRGVGPWTNEGFYQDFDFGSAEVSDKEFKKIEKKMRWLINKDFKLVKRMLSADEARAEFPNDEYKLELIDEIEARGEALSFYDFVGEEGRVVYTDLCAGPHLESTGQTGVFKVTKLAGAYWRGDENKAQLTRIYGVAFPDDEGLQAYLTMLEEAAKRDHRKLGKELELFAFDEEVGPGLPLWLPKGTVIVDQLEDLAKETEERFGYQRVRSPHIAKEKLYLRSGHLPYYAEDMFPPMELDNEKYFLKAMNCPHHHKIFGSTPKSYRDLPVRFAEYGHCYRYEDSGSLFGLMRVRSLCMNDAHIYCNEDQFEAEFSKVIEMYLYYFKLFGIEKYQMRLSKHVPEKLGKKYVDEAELWIKTEDQVRQALVNLNVPFVEAEDEAAFYGPKIDVQIWSAIGREFTLATNQLDFSVPKKFNLTYVDKDGSEKTPICIHRAPLSTHERFVGFLIEHYAGAFPAWLAPVQAQILPVNTAHEDFAQKLQQDLVSEGVRVEHYDSSDSLGKRIRNSQKAKTPFTIVIGDKEVASGDLTIRRYGEEKEVSMTVEDFKKTLRR